MSYEDSRRYGSSSRRDSSPSRHRRDRRSRSPGTSSRNRSPIATPRRDNELPDQFGRVFGDLGSIDTLNVLQQMKSSFNSTPLGSILQCIYGNSKLKVWTRNFKEVRGICTGYVTAFDKHWNLVMTDVDEVFLKPRKAKTPFLSDLRSSEPLPELEPKVPRKKKTPSAAVETADKEKSATEKETPPTEEEQPETKAEQPEKEKEQASAETTEGTTEKKKKKKRSKNKGPTTGKRHIKQLFIRGDNIVMISVLTEEDNAAVKVEEEEEDEDEH